MHCSTAASNLIDPGSIPVNVLMQLQWNTMQRMENKMLQSDGNTDRKTKDGITKCTIPLD
jgi:hypothetical protein